MIVDTLESIVTLVVHPADIQDCDGVRLLIQQLGTGSRRLLVIFADRGYTGKFVHWAEGWYSGAIEIVKRTAISRWIVERTCAWLGG